MKYSFDGVIVYSTTPRFKCVPFNLSKEEDRKKTKGKMDKKIKMRQYWVMNFA